MVALARTPARMTVAEFLAWEPGDGHRWQLVDGEPQPMSPATRTHGTLQLTLGSAILRHLESISSACVAITEAGIVPHVQSRTNVRIADIAVTCSGYVIEESTLTEPVLIVEVLSPSNQAETWSNVWTYTSIPSVREILVLHSGSVAAEVLRRHADQSWPQTTERIESGLLELRSIGFSTSLTDLYRGTRFARQP